MRRQKGFTLIELLAVILILGIIALIAIPTVNNILKESRTGAWKSTASQMTKAAENYYQLQIIKNAPYVTNFRTSESSTANKYMALAADGKSFEEVDTPVSEVVAENVMLAALSLKGDIPSLSQIKVFTIDANGEVALAFDNANAYCMTIAGTTFDATDYANATDDPSAGTTAVNDIVAGGTAVCIAK